MRGAYGSEMKATVQAVSIFTYWMLVLLTKWMSVTKVVGSNGHSTASVCTHG